MVTRSIIQHISVISFSLLIQFPLVAQWQRVNPGQLGNAIIQAFEYNKSGLWVGTASKGLFLSTDGGASWNPKNNGISEFYDFATVGSNTYVATDSGVFVSTNDGSNWTTKSNGLRNEPIVTLAVCGSNIFAGNFATIFLSTNNGDNWVVVDSSFPGNLAALVANDSNIFAVIGRDIYRSSDSASYWQKIYSSPKDGIWSISVNGTNVYAGTIWGILHSSDNGTSWNFQGNGLEGTIVTGIAVSGANLFATSVGAVYVSTDTGASWVRRGAGLPNAWINTIILSDTSLFVGTNNAGIWKRGLWDILNSLDPPTLANEPKDNLSHYYLLAQNYPNPFNPSTVIEYRIPTAAIVRLTLYDALGNQAKILVNQRQSAGTYRIELNAISLASGIYFYQLRANNFSQTKRLILLR